MKPLSSSTVIIVTFALLQCGRTTGSHASLAANALSREAEFDFGEVAEGVILSHAFSISNHSPEIVKLLEPHASCNCIASVLGSTELLPGQSTSVKLTYDTLEHLGQIRGYVDVGSDANKLQRMRFEISGNVTRHIMRSPNEVKLEGIIRGSPTTEVVRLTSTDGSPVVIEKAECNMKDLAIQSTAEPGALLVSLRPLGPAQTRYGEIRVDLTQSSQQRVRIPIVVCLRKTYEASPRDRVSFGTIDPDKHPERIVSFNSVVGDNKFDVLSARIVDRSNESTECEFAEAAVLPKSENEISIRIRITKTPPRSYFMLRLLVTTTDPDNPNDELPICGFVGEKLQTPTLK